MRRSILFLFVLVFLGSSINSNASYFQDASTQETGKQIAFQGTLYENGVAVNGERTFTFTIPIDENTSWTETKENVQVVEGLYSVVLGSQNALPESLFYDVKERELTIAIGSTQLGTTKLFAPFAPKPIGPIDDLPRRIEIDNAKADSDTVFYFDISADTKTENFYQRGLQINMTGAGRKMALRGNTISQAGEGNGAISIIGSATGEGSGSHEGVRGQAFGAGKFNSGVLGLAGGAGNGGTGFEGDGSYNTGVVGYGQNNAWGNTGVTGYAVGTKGEDNVGVVGIANVRADENDNQRNNTGVVARASGLGYNKALFARAENGVENWAGWFEGNVALREGADLSLFNNNGDKRLDLDYFADNDAGSLLTYNHKNQRAALLGSGSDRTGGLFTLYDSLENGVVQLRATSRPGTWPTDKRPHGQLDLRGPSGQSFYMGAKVWEQNGADVGVFQMFGAPVDDGQGNIGKPEMLYLSSEFDAAGQQQATLSLLKEGGGRATLNHDNTNSLLGLIEGRGKYRFETNAQNSGVLKLMSSVDSVSVLLDSNGEKAGLLMLNDSLGRENLGLYAYPGGAAYMKMTAGAENIGQTRVTAQYWGGLEPYVNLIGRDADGNATGRAQMGKLFGNEGYGFRVTAPDFRSLVNIEGNTNNGGQLSIEGPSTSNFWLGQKNWENSNLPYMAMRGENTVTNNNGDTYVPDGVSLEVSRYGDGGDVGVLNLRRIKDGTEESVGLDYFQLNELVNPSNQKVIGANGNDVARLERRADNFGQAVFFNSNNELRAEIGSFGDNSGFMQLYAPNGNKNMQLGGTDGARDYGMFKLFDNNGQDMFQMQTEDNNGKQVPFFRMGNNQNLDQNNYPKDAIKFGLGSDNNGDGKYSTYFNMEGPDAPLIQMGAHGWEQNDGSNRARIALFGSDSENDGNGNTYTPERVGINVGKDGGTTEFGRLNISNTSGGGFEIGARDWENNGQGGTLTYTAIKSTVDVDDGNGGTYRPWLVSQQFHQDGNGTQFGTVNVSSTNNSTFVNINDGNSGNIDISGSFNQSSDKRLKKNIETLTSGLAIVNRLRGVRYNWKDETRTENKIGFIAQEVEEVLPELVKTKENGLKGVNYAEMTAVLVEAVKELTAQIEELKSENASLKAEASKVQSLEDRLSRIEALLINPKTSNADQK